MIRTLLLTAALCFSAAATAQDDAARPAGTLDRFFPFWADYLAIDADLRTHFGPDYRIQSSLGIPIDDIEFWYELDGEEFPFILDDDGMVLDMPDADLLAQAPEVWVNQPQGSMSLEMGITASLPPAERYDRDELERALVQANEAKRAIAGVAALFAPDFKTLIFQFEDSVPGAWLEFADGRREPMTVQANQAVFFARQRRNRGVERIIFEHPPTRIVLNP